MVGFGHSAALSCRVAKIARESANGWGTGQSGNKEWMGVVRYFGFPPPGCVRGQCADNTKEHPNRIVAANSPQGQQISEYARHQLQDGPFRWNVTHRNPVARTVTTRWYPESPGQILLCDGRIDRRRCPGALLVLSGVVASSDFGSYSTGSARLPVDAVLFPANTAVLWW